MSLPLIYVTCTYSSLGESHRKRTLSWAYLRKDIISTAKHLSCMYSDILQYILLPYTTVMEITEVKRRSLIGIQQFTLWTLGAMLYPAWAYFIREWRWLQTAVTLQCLLFLPTILSVHTYFLICIYSHYFGLYILVLS